MITAILTMAVTWCLFYNRIPLPALCSVSVGIGIIMVILGRHRHSDFLTIDVIAQVSPLKIVNPLLKFTAVLTLMVICIVSKSPVVGAFVAMLMLVLIVWGGRLKLHEYIHLLTIPVSFLMISGLALLFEISTRSSGILSIHVLGFWLNMSAKAQTDTLLILSRSIGSISCLYLLSLTTPMSDIIGVLRRARCPKVIIELMYLIYRYLFILLNMYHTMKSAAKSRLGYIDFKTQMRTTAGIYSNMLSRSYRLANINFDAMESRCYDTEIRFLEKQNKITVLHASVAVSIVIFIMGLTIFLY